VIESDPLGRVDRLIVATPLLTVHVPMEEPPEEKVTTPPVAGEPEAATEAEKATLEPKAGLVVEAVSVVVVIAGATVTRTALEAEAAKLVVPA
jgi:hypothetical protein